MKKILLILAILFLIMFFVIMVIKDDKDFCLDSGICAENIKLNTEYGTITINENTCNMYNWIWNSEKHYCHIK